MSCTAASVLNRNVMVRVKNKEYINHGDYDVRLSCDLCNNRNIATSIRTNSVDLFKTDVWFSLNDLSIAPELTADNYLNLPTYFCCKDKTYFYELYKLRKTLGLNSHQIRSSYTLYRDTGDLIEGSWSVTGTFDYPQNNFFHESYESYGRLMLLLQAVNCIEDPITSVYICSVCYAYHRIFLPHIPWNECHPYSRIYLDIIDTELENLIFQNPDDKTYIESFCGVKNAEGKRIFKYEDFSVHCMYHEGRLCGPYVEYLKDEEIARYDLG